MKPAHIKKLKALQEQLLCLTEEAYELRHAMQELQAEIEDTDPQVENRITNAVAVLEPVVNMNTDLLSRNIF